MNPLHHAIDAHAAQAQAEGRAMAQRAMTDINNKVGFMNRSAAQIRRYEKAKKEKQHGNSTRNTD